MDDYWKRRYLKDKAASVNRTEDYLVKQQKKLYSQAEQEIREQIERLYKRFANAEQISLAEAKHRVSDADFRRIDWDGMLKESEELRKRMQEDLPEGIRENLEKQHQALDQTMKTYAKRGRVSYLELRGMEIDRIMVSLYDSQQQNIYDYLQSEYDDGYYKSIYNTQQRMGFGYDFTRPNEEAVNTAILNRQDKRNFSKSLYAHCTNFSEDLKSSLVTGLITGENLDRMASRIHKRMDVAYSRAKTLVRTETAYIYETSTMAGYSECGIEWYEFLATLDYKTSEICQEMDGQHFKVKDAVPGKNFPPMHPNCRSTTVCWFPGEEDKKAKTTRIAKNGSGKYYEVPADMTYREWRGQHKDKNPFLSYGEKRALNQYCSFESYQVNEKLRKHTPLTDQEKRMVDRLNSALDKMDDYKGNVVRCLDIRNPAELEAFLRQHQEEGDVTYEAFTSASIEEGYNPDANIRIYIESGHGKDITSFNSGEKEVLYKRNSTFRVSNHTEKNGIHYFLLEEKDG